MDKGITIILGERDCGHAILTERRLSYWGFEYTVIRFDDGRGIVDFLRILKDNNFLFDRQYLVLASYSMPQMDGMEVLKAIKQDMTLKHIPFIMLTDGRGKIDIDDCFDTGCDAILSKPLKKEAFAMALANIGVTEMSSLELISRV